MNTQIKKQKKVQKSDPRPNGQVDETVLLKASLARALADYANLEKRVQRDALEVGTRIRSQFLTRLLPALQTLYSVQNHLNDPGLAVSIGQFEEIIKEEGIEKIEPQKGEHFDEELHEVIDTEESEEKKGTIAELIEQGWRFSEGGTIKHAKVKVYK